MMMVATPPLAIIIPVGPGDTSWVRLVEDLSCLRDQVEICFVGTTQASPEFTQFIQKNMSHLNVSWVVAPIGRAKQLNLGVDSTSARVLWFLHADSRLSITSIQAVLKWISTKQERDLGYLDLRFQSDGPVFTKINDKGTWFRSHVFKLPFGDQGLCLSRSFFELLGRFDESVSYGEDHLMVWKARKNDGRVVWMGAEIESSARKYKSQGWLKTTLLHLVLTAKQALPQAYELWARRGKL